MNPEFKNLLIHGGGPLLETLSVLITLMIVVLLVHSKQKKFNSTDPFPELLQFIPQNSPISTATVEVSTGIYIKNFTDFDFILNKFVIDMIVWFEFNPSLIDLDVIKKFSFEKGKILNISEPEMKAQKDRLLVKYNVQVSIATNLNNRLFPFNDHSLFIVLLNEYVSPNEMVFRVYESYFSWSESIHTEDWNIRGKTVESGYTESCLDHADPKKNLVHPRAVFTLKFERAGIRKTLLVILPIFLVLFIGLISLSLDPIKLTGTLFSLSVGSVSGLLAYRFVLEKISPNVGYFTAMDHLYFTILGCSFLTFIVIFLLFSAPAYRPIVIILAKIVFFSTQILLILMTYFLLYVWHKPPKESSKNEQLKIKNKAHIVPKKLTLDFLKYYAAHSSEYPSPDTNNWLNPDYSNFHMKNLPSLFRRIKKRIHNIFHPKQQQYWLPEIFYFYMKKIMTESKRFKFLHKDILKITIEDPRYFVLWGDLKGAFHSLCRDLGELERRGIIDNNLKIILDNFYLVFNGDAINRAPYVLETMTVIMYLIHNNPDKVLYIKGNHESKELWYNYQLAKELKIRARSLSKLDIPFKNLINSFLNALPQVLYLRVAHKNEPSLIRISHFTTNEFDFDESNYAQFLYSDQEPNTLTAINLKDKMGLNSNFKVDVIFRGIERAVGYRRIGCIEQLPPENGATTWSLLSSPTSSYQILYRFFTDCFAILNIERKLSNCAFSVLKQDTRHIKGFSCQNFSLYYGFEVTNMKHWQRIPKERELIVGSSLDLARTSSILGKRLFHGLRLGLDDINQHHDVNDYFIHQIFLDDQYTPPLARKNILRFLNVYGINILLTPSGTPTVEAFFPLVERKELLVLFPYTGASIFRKPELDHFIHFRTSYANEAKALVKYAIELNAVRRLAFFYQDDSYGRAALEGAQEQIKNYDLVDFIEIPYQRNIPNVAEAATKIQQFNPNAILFFSTSTQAIALVHKLGVNYLVSKKLLGISFLTDAFRDYLESCGLDLSITRVVPSINTDFEIIHDFKKISKHFNMNDTLNEDSLEAYINIQILHEVVHRISGSITKEKIITELENLKNFNLKGIHLNFDPLKRELSKNVWIDQGDGFWILMSKD